MLNRPCLYSKNIFSASLWIQYSGVLILTACFSFLSSCKDPNDLGLEVQPKSDQLLVLHSDTATLITKTVREDSLAGNSVGLQFLYQLLGSYTDPVFGRSDASFFTQVNLGLLPVLGSSTDILIPDSLILSLQYGGYYGDTTTTQVVHVYRIGEDILSGSTYYTNKNFYYDSYNDLANSYKFSVRPTDSVGVLSAGQPAQMRIPLSLSLASEFLALNGQAAFASNSNWLQYFKGLYIKTDPEYGHGKGAISYCDLNSGYSRLTLYFKKITAANDTMDSLHYDFDLSGALRVNHAEHVYSSASPELVRQLSDSVFNVNDTLNYVQAMSGLKTKITFPYLKHFVDSGNVVVNKAELDITVQSNSTGFYAAPPKLNLLAIDTNSAFIYLLPDQSEGAFYFGGYYNSTTYTYQFNIARQVQRILDGTITDYGLYLVVSGAVVEANRAVIGSGKNSNCRMKLKLYYTKLH